MGSLPVPTLMLIGGVVLGVLFALVCRVLVRVSVRRRVAVGRGSDCVAAISEVADEVVIRPVKAELAAYAGVREGLLRALG